MKTEPCKACNRLMVWLRTKKDKRMPVDAETVQEGDEVYEHGKHTSHFATCPKADLFRRKP